MAAGLDDRGYLPRRGQQRLRVVAVEIDNLLAGGQADVEPGLGGESCESVREADHREERELMAAG
jgi:hypothetical protein